MKQEKSARKVTESVRLDRWLWAARFYKTRALAAEAVSRGNVRINRSTARPSRSVRVDDELEIRKSPYARRITIDRVSGSRGPATVASGLYREHPESIEERKMLSRQLRLDQLSRPDTTGRPDKHQRHAIINLKKKN